MSLSHGNTLIICSCWVCCGKYR